MADSKPNNKSKKADSIQKTSSQKSVSQRPGLPRGILLAILFLVVIVGEFFLIREFACEVMDESQESEDVQEQFEANSSQTEAMMLLIEYKDTVGLTNFVNELANRDISSALLATPEFVQDNCDTIKKLMQYDMEIIGSHTAEPLWGMSYEDQYERISEIKQGVEACTGQPLKIVGSRFFASDETTAKVADELGIPYITARGTTGTKATVYEPEDYDVKVLSVSNIEDVDFKYGSLCDYSYWTRGGNPSDMREDLQDSIDRYGKVTPVSHTNIGGYLQDWVDMWIDFWDENEEIEWISLDELMQESDYTMPFYKIPQNQNAPYTPQMLEHVETDEQAGEEQDDVVDNPCAVEDLPELD
jgi:hypothetical protein